MTRPWHIWTAFALCFAVVLVAVAWLSVTVVRSERAEVEARQQAATEENVRLALWRMDSALAPLIAQEGARPYFQYNSFYPAERAYTRMFREIEYGDVLMPSPLMRPATPYILLYFQIDADGEFSSPEVPSAALRPLAEPRYVDAAQVTAAAERLTTLQAAVTRRTLLAALPFDVTPTSSPVIARVGAPGPQMATAQQQMRKGGQQQELRNSMEVQARDRAMQQTQGFNDSNRLWAGSLDSMDVTAGALTPLWEGDTLLLARRVALDGGDYVQGCWLDWPAIRTWLAGEIADIFPHAELLPVHGTHSADAARSLAALPVRLVPGPPALALEIPRSPTVPFLAVMTLCVLSAAVAVALLLFGTISLSERRGAFVSAVTHELRTPLTTFRLYTDLLLEGHVTAPEKQRKYLETLHAEAVRLGHLVENVLAYARLENRRGGVHVRSASLAELWQRTSERLADRAQLAEMQLVVEPLDDALAGAQVRAEAGVVEQILFNLVDNACKYATDATDKRIHLSASGDTERIRLRVRDHGPGIPADEAGRLFRPFHKSARDAAHSAPGVGLGLALSRRLARSLGGELALVSTDEPGACFELVLRAEHHAVGQATA